MTEIPLEGFLLTPVQKICKYHLQLAELLKYTAPEHPDFPHVQAAVDAMKKIATLVNERKRKMESIEKLASWQLLVDDWEVGVNKSSLGWHDWQEKWGEGMSKQIFLQNILDHSCKK